MMQNSKKNGNGRGQNFLKMMAKNHVFDSVMGSEIVGNTNT